MLYFYVYLYLIFSSAFLIRKMYSSFVNTNVSVTWNFPGIKMSLTRSFVWGEILNNNIDMLTDLSVDEAYNGKTSIFTYRRRAVNDECKPNKCTKCNGSGYINFHHRNVHKGYDHSVTSPCPECLSTGYTFNLQACSPYVTIEEEIRFSTPPGCLHGHKIEVPGKGHETYVLGEKTVGNLFIKVNSIKSGNMEVTSECLQMTIQMTPVQAIEGFVMDLPFINNKTLHIDRSKKITLPNSKVVLREVGLPRLETEPHPHDDGAPTTTHPTDPYSTQPTNTSVIEVPTTSTSIARGDLVIIFELTPPPVYEEVIGSETMSNTDGVVHETVGGVGDSEDAITILGLDVEEESHRKRDAQYRELLQLLQKMKKAD